MTEKQIEQMITELQNSQISTEINEPTPFNFKIAESSHLETHVNYNTKKRTNQQLVRSVLYMSYLIRSGKKNSTSNDFLVDALETITSLMDNLYLVTKFGIGKNSKFLQKVSKNASKVWFVTLLFTIKNLVGKIISLVRLKSNILKELKKCEENTTNYELSKIIINKYELKIQEIKGDIVAESLELVGTLNDLFFVSLEIFDWKINARLEKMVGMISAVMSIYRMTRKSG